MPFDANLVLIDGTKTFTAATAASFVAATSTTRESTNTGAAVIDLKGTGEKGLAAVLIIPVLATATDYLTMLIEGSEEEAFGESVYYNKTLVVFNKAGVTDGRILASECTAGLIVVQRFATELRYVRAKGIPTVGNSTGTFGTLQVLLSPYPFTLL